MPKDGSWYDGSHRPILVVKDQDRVYAFDNRCPHMGFPLDRGSVEDGILTCHWHHARFDLASGCTFDLWADDVPTCPVEVRGGEVWVKAEFGHSEPAAYWRQRLEVGMAHNLGLTIAKAVAGSTCGRRGPARDSAPGRTVRRPESRRLGHGNDRPDRPWEPLAHSTGGGDLSGALPWRQTRSR